MTTRAPAVLTNQGGSKKGRPMSGQRWWSSLDQGRMEGKVFSVSSLDLIKSFLSGTGGPTAPLPLRTMLAHASFRRGGVWWDWPFVRSERRGTSNVPKTRASLPCQRTFGRKKRAKFLWFYWVQHVTHVFTEAGSSLGLTRYGTEG